ENPENHVKAFENRYADRKPKRERGPRAAPECRACGDTGFFSARHVSGALDSFRCPCGADPPEHHADRPEGASEHEVDGWERQEWNERKYATHMEGRL